MSIGNQGPAVCSATNTPYIGAADRTAPTCKPRHIIWYYDNSWWAIFFVPDAAASGNGEFHIFKKNGSWVDETNAGRSDTPDGRDTSRPDVVLKGDDLWIYSVHGTQSRIYKFLYSAGGWRTVAGFPKNASGANNATGIQYTNTFTIDTNNWLWVFWIPPGTGNRDIQYAYSNNEGTNWTTGNLSALWGTVPQVVQIEKLYTLKFNDGIASLGLVVSDELDNQMVFNYRRDSDVINAAWQVMETIESDAGWIDDHIDALADDTNVWVSNKTSIDINGQPTTVLYKRDPTGIWTRYIVWNQRSGRGFTRPRIAIDDTHNEIYVFATAHNGAYANNLIQYVKTSLSAPSFTPNADGTTVIDFLDIGVDVNNVCITKENHVDSSSGLYPVACDDLKTVGNRYYYWGEIEILPVTPLEGVLNITGITTSIQSSQGEEITFIVHTKNNGIADNFRVELIGDIINSSEFSLGAGLTKDVTFLFTMPTQNVSITTNTYHMEEAPPVDTLEGYGTFNTITEFNVWTATIMTADGSFSYDANGFIEGALKGSTNVGRRTQFEGYMSKTTTSIVANTPTTLEFKWKWDYSVLHTDTNILRIELVKPDMSIVTLWNSSYLDPWSSWISKSVDITNHITQDGNYEIRLYCLLNNENNRDAQTFCWFDEVFLNYTTRAPSYINVTSTPAGAAVLLDTVNIGVTPISNHEVSTGGGGGAITLVQSKTYAQVYGQPAYGITITLDSVATNGNLIVTGVAIDKASGAITVPTGFTLIQKGEGGISSGAMAYKISDGTEQSITWNWTELQEGTVWVGEFSGLAKTDVLDTSTENESYLTASDNGSHYVGPVTTNQADELAIAIYFSDSGNSVGSTQSFSDGFTTIAKDTDTSGSPFIHVANKILTSIGTVETTHIHDGTGDESYTILATFKAGSGDHTLDITLAGYEPVQETFAIIDGETKNFNYDLVPT